MSYTVEYKSSSLEDLKQLNRQIQSRIIKKIIWLAENFEDIEPLTLSANLAGTYTALPGVMRYSNSN
jgi:mRNA interferase RelE/StbE